MNTICINSSDVIYVRNYKRLQRDVNVFVEFVNIANPVSPGNFVVFAQVLNL